MSGEIYRKPIMFSIVALVVILIGTIATVFYPMLTPMMHPKLENLVQLSPLELAGKDVYQQEGCMGCHTQTVRPLKSEVMRYGEYSKAGEFAYDRPFLWGSKRTGPDLARIGLRWPIAKLHYDHFEDPRSFVEKSNMPSYGFLKEYMLEPDSVKSHMDAQNFKYTEDEIKALEGKSQLDALVAYMLWLGHAVKPQVADAAGDVSAGGPLFLENCSGCHGAEGEGGFGPAFTDNVWLGNEGDVSDERLTEIISKGTGKGMPPFEGAFSDEQMYDLVGHIRSFAMAGELSPAALSVKAGKAVFSKLCFGCHGADATGGFGPNLTDNVWLGKEGDITGDRLGEIITKGTAKGMPPFGEVLTHDDLDAVIKFIMSLKEGGF
jgi:cytochrome c oxidase cbb3-type subunit 2